MREEKKCYEVEMCDDQLRFLLFLVFTFSSSKKLNFLIQSNIRQVPNILVFLSSCTRPTSFACFWREERCPCSSSTESRRRMFGPGEEFLGAQSTTIFFFFFINGSSKESKPSEAHPRIFFLVSSSSSDDARQSY